MSTDKHLTSKDMAALEAASTNGRGSQSSESTDVDALRSAILHTGRGESDGPDIRAELDEVKTQLEQERRFKKRLVAKVNRIEDAIENDGNLAVGRTTLEKFSSMSEDDREELLGPSDRRAVEIYEHWDELAWTAGHMGSERLMETKARANAKHQPAKIKYRLEQHFDESLAWNEIYRVMKAVARLSGGEEETGEYGRTKILGGDFEYEETTTADGSDTRRVLKEVTR